MTNSIVDSALRSSVPCVPGQCPHCDKQGLLILPIRYSAFCSADDAAVQAAPTLAARSGPKAPPELTTSKYALRMMREGYLYVLVRRAGLIYWEAYYVRPTGQLMRFPVGTPPERKNSNVSCARMAASADARLVGIDKPEEVEATYWLFTPDPLSEAKLQEYRDNAEAYAASDLLQKFSPQQWVAGTRGNPFETLPETIECYVLEYCATRGIEATPILDSPLMKALDEQAFPPFRDPLQGFSVQDFLSSLSSPGGYGNPSRLRSHAGVLRDILGKLKASQGLGLALHDPLGITQELNAWRNAAMEGLEPWMQQEDSNGASNEWKFLSATQLQEVRQGIRDARILAAQTAAERAYDSQLDQLREAFDHPVTQSRFGEEWAQATKARVEAAHHSDPLGALARSKAEAKQRTEAHLAKCDALLDGTQQQVLRDFERLAAPCEALMRERAPDHLAWLQSQPVLDALNAYDPNDWQRGWAFAIQTSLAMVGMEASEEGQGLLERWWQDTEMADGNLAWRTYGLNHEQLIADTRQVLAEAKAQADQPEALDVGAAIASGLGTASKVLKAFKQANSALEACEKAGQVAWFQRTRLGAVMGWYAQLGRAVFKSALPNAVDRRMQRVMVRALQMRMGEFALKLRLDELQSTGQQDLRIAYARGQVQRRIREALEAEFGKQAAGRFYQVRFLTIVSMVESANFMIKAGKLPAEGQQKAELAAAGLGLAAGSLELIGLGSTWVGEHYSTGSNVARHSKVWGGRLRLYGGFLGGAAGVTGAVLDFQSAKDEAGQGRNLLAISYISRSLVITTATLMGATVAFAGSAPYLQHLMRNSGNRVLASALRHLSGWAARLAARQSAMLMLRTWGARLGWIGLGVTALIIILTPDAYEKWCEKSVFRKRKDKKGYENAGEELAALHVVLKEVSD